MSQGVLSRRRRPPRGQRARERRRLSERPLIWLLPLALLLFVSYVYPAIDVIRYSFTNATLLNPEFDYTTASYRGGDRQPRPAGHPVGHLHLRRRQRRSSADARPAGRPGAPPRRQTRACPASRLVRIIILSAWIVPGVAGRHRLAADVQRGELRLPQRASCAVPALPPVAWLSDPHMAVWSAVIANVWRGTAFSMILLYAGLLVIPSSLYEAASVDGATARQAVLVHHAAAAPADPPDQHHPDQHLHPQHLRSDPAADRRRAGTGDGGSGALCLQHGLPQFRPVERRRAGGAAAPDQRSPSPSSTSGCCRRRADQ